MAFNNHLSTILVGFDTLPLQSPLRNTFINPITGTYYDLNNLTNDEVVSIIDRFNVNTGLINERLYHIDSAFYASLQTRLDECGTLIY